MLQFWGKTAERSGPQSRPFKPVLHHLIDVAAAALRLQQQFAVRTSREADVLGVPVRALTLASAYLAGLHDLGKFSASFQAKRPELWPKEALGPLRQPGDRGHWRNTSILLHDRALASELQSIFPELENGLHVLIASIAGHHGRPPKGGDEFGCDPSTARRDLQIGAASLAAALAAMRALKSVIEPEPIFELRELEQCQAWSWRLAGLTTLADWIGSDAEIFQFEDPQMPLERYWDLARDRADRAIHSKGLGPIAPALRAGLAELAPHIANPRPMQLMAEDLALTEGPQLVIIEDTTGSGKTEAALVLAGRMIAAGKAEGLYFALPTMATANAMYGRLGDLHHRLFAAGARPTLVLAHGHASLSQPFLDSIERPANGDPREEDVAAFCSEWIADSRRKAFFASVGAGTIDQAFLAVLRKRYLTLRQYGLAGRILLVDEAHSFDAYMGRELETLLAVHAAAGGSAIVLSATLPQAKRQAMIGAFRTGLGRAVPIAIESQNYPLASSASRDEVVEQSVDFAEALRREVKVVRLADADAAHAVALAAARQGASVLVMRNAVDEAIASYEVLCAAHSETQLFHARFAMCDRQRIELDVLGRFGPKSMPVVRASHILVATQVVEQSLDLDFDFVVTDLAPVDLIIQRAGRLWRHMDRRPAEQRPVQGPTIHVISPEPNEGVGEDWLNPVLGRGASVYRHPGIMWRSAKTLFESGTISTPDGLRGLIEAVYGSGEVPEGLSKQQDKAEGEIYGRRTHAQGNLIRIEDGYAGLGDLSIDEEIGTRDGEKTVSLRLARLEHGGLMPWARGKGESGDARSPRHDWAMSEVSVRKNWLGNFELPQHLVPLADMARAGWPDWDMTQIVVVNADGSIGNAAPDATPLTYHRQQGLRRIVPPTRE